MELWHQCWFDTLSASNESVRNVLDELHIVTPTILNDFQHKDIFRLPCKLQQRFRKALRDPDWWFNQLNSVEAAEALLNEPEIENEEGLNEQEEPDMARLAGCLKPSHAEVHSPLLLCKSQMCAAAQPEHCVLCVQTLCIADVCRPCVDHWGFRQ